MRGMKNVSCLLVLLVVILGFGCVENGSGSSETASIESSAESSQNGDDSAQTGEISVLADQPGHYVLNMYHFNLQYVAGCDVCMDRVIQSFEPLVDFYAAHPEYGADFEMQGMMIEYMAENYPDVLDRFRGIVNTGQVDLVSFHYSDQLLMAYPAHDQQWSIDINNKIFEKYDIKRSGTIFAQEAMFSEGMADMGARNGFNVAVMTGSIYGWFQDSSELPYYTCRGLDVLRQGGAVFPNSGIEVDWEFVGDGETVTSFDPYFPVLQWYVKYSIAKLEDTFADYVNNGCTVSTVSKYVDALRAAGETPTQLKPILDTPWRPGDGSGVYQWMGKYVFPWEEDYTVLTGNWTARSCLMAFERKYGSVYPDKVEEAWRNMLEAEVSDSTGWRPVPAEIDYSKDHADAVLAIIQSVDPSLLSNAWTDPDLDPADSGPVDVSISGNLIKKEVRWYTFPGQENVWVVDIDLKKFPLLVWPGLISIDFPYDSDVIEYSPAMLENEVRTISINDIKHNPIHLGVPNGLIGLGGGLYLIRDNNYGVLAARLDIDGKKISYQALNPSESELQMRFYLVKGDQETVLTWANMINNINL